MTELIKGASWVDSDGVRLRLPASALARLHEESPCFHCDTRTLIHKMLASVSRIKPCDACLVVLVAVVARHRHTAIFKIYNCEVGVKAIITWFLGRGRSFPFDRRVRSIHVKKWRKEWSDERLGNGRSFCRLGRGRFGRRLGQSTVKGISAEEANHCRW